MSGERLCRKWAISLQLQKFSKVAEDRSLQHLKLRFEIVEAGRRMNALRINQGTSGNISARVAEGVLITPSGVPLDDMDAKDLVVADLRGAVRDGRLRPSSEWRLHCDILRERSEICAVVHAHAMYCTALACLGRNIPAFHYMVAVAGGDSIRCAPYATFGTQALSDNVVAALDGRRACLMANHGMVAVGATVRQALALALEVETLAAQYWHALQVGTPNLLTREEMEIVLEKFSNYGQQARSD